MADEKIGDKEYEHVLGAWGRLEMKAMKYHHNLCLKCDVLLLADVFGRLRNSSFKNYGSCPSHY